MAGDATNMRDVLSWISKQAEDGMGVAASVAIGYGDASMLCSILSDIKINADLALEEIATPSEHLPDRTVG